LRKDLWGYVHEDSVADAFLLAVTDESGRWSGHEAFFIVAPRIAPDEDSAVLRQKYWPNVPIKENRDVSGETGFFDCGKAERLLGWVHRDGLSE
jgi:nucleoside-diphosphate-sugar epimerase